MSFKSSSNLPTFFPIGLLALFTAEAKRAAALLDGEPPSANGALLGLEARAPLGLRQSTNVFHMHLHSYSVANCGQFSTPTTLSI